MRRRGIVGALLTLALLGCSEPQPASQNSRRPLYFDVKGLVEQQMQALDQRQRAVTKRVTLRDGATETVRVPAVKWANELQVFLQADINKAALRGAYAMDSTMQDGQLRRTYTRRQELDHAPVRQLTVMEQGGVPQELTAEITQANPLFVSSKQLHMQFEAGQLRSYDVHGTQKLIFFDALQYSTAGRVE